MLNIVVKIPIKCIYQTFVIGKGFKSNGIDKIRCIFRHQHMDIRMQFY